MHVEYDPGAELARVLHWLVQAFNAFVQTFTRASVIASLMMSLPKLSVTGIATSAVTTTAAASHKRMYFIVRSSSARG
jgi:hypothetical protein